MRVAASSVLRNVLFIPLVPSGSLLCKPCRFSPMRNFPALAGSHHLHSGGSRHGAGFAGSR
jgi:hypothetical protein